MLDVDAALIAAGRRIAAAVAQLEAAQQSPSRACSNCAAPLVVRRLSAAYHFECSCCGQLEAATGFVLVAGEPNAFRVELTELGRGALDLALLEQAENDVETMTESELETELSRMRAGRAGLETWDGWDGSEP